MFLKIADDWKIRLFKHWSSWVFYGIFALSMVPDALGLLGDRVEIPSKIYTTLVIVGLLCKIVPQGNTDANQ